MLSPAAASDHSFWNKLLLPITIGISAQRLASYRCTALVFIAMAMAYWWLAIPGRANPRSPQRLLSEVLPSFRMTGHTVLKTNPGLLAHGLSFPIKLLPDADRFFPELRALTLKSTLNGEIAYELDPTHSSAFDVKMSTHPRHIFFLERVHTVIAA